jgi:hypothetical protein
MFALLDLDPRIARWGAQVVATDDADADAPDDAELCRLLFPALVFQAMRGGGIFVVAVPA